MEEVHRNQIKNNIEKLINLTNYDELMAGCLSSEILVPAMRKGIENVDKVEKLSIEKQKYEWHKRLFIKLTERGPNAFQDLKNLLMVLHFEKAVQLLNQYECNKDNEFRSLHPNNQVERELRMVGKFGHNPKSEEDGIRASKAKKSGPKLEVYTGSIKPKNYIVKKSKVTRIHEKIAVYPMSREQRGVFFMVNIIDFPYRGEIRQGAKQDGESLLYIFNELGFKLFAYENITQSEFFSLLDELIHSSYTYEAECFVMALMTHGTMDEHFMERVEFHDSSIIKVRDIEDRFKNQHCPNLVHKPKILIFPFCRGEDQDLGVQTDGFPEVKPRILNERNHTLSDILICHASLLGYKAHRDVVEGSWYVQNFCRNVAEHAHDTDFEDIIKMTQRDTSILRTAGGAMQMGCYTNKGFNKKLYLNPGVVRNGTDP